MNLTIEMPDDLARSLEGLAAAENKTVQQLAVERCARSSRKVLNIRRELRAESYARCASRVTRVFRRSENSRQR